MQEFRPGLWTWTAPHPDWTPDKGGPDGWEREVRSYAYDAGEGVVLIDPLFPPSLVDELASGKDVAVVLTIPWHQRSAPDVVERLGAHVFAVDPDSHDVTVPATRYSAGETLPGGVEARPALYPEEAILWISEHGALVTGDAVLVRADGVQLAPASWLPEGTSPADLAETLTPLLDLPVELLLPTHGDPVADDAAGALRRALAL